MIYNNKTVYSAQMSINWLLNKQNVIYLYNGIWFGNKGNEVLTSATAQTNFENIIRNQRSQSWRLHTVKIHLYEEYRVNKFIVTESKLFFSTEEREGELGSDC